MPSTSRITHGKGVASSTSTERFVPFMLRRPRATPLGAWEEALSNSDRTRQCAGAASRDCTALWWIGIFGTNVSVKRNGDHHCGRRNHKIRSEYLDCLADDLKMSRSRPIFDYRNVTPSELQSSTPKRDCARAMFPLDGNLPPLRAALAISIDECGLCFHEPEQVRATNSPRREGRRTFTTVNNQPLTTISSPSGRQNAVTLG
jgi:hypothetical protein